ncbi:MAG: NusA-like transcription termination signal-binding factor [Nanoarchaeota archaeon]|nr:NusA-like transcription termination signal-binding factor [Nanoarchaeota archaeon]
MGVKLSTDDIRIIAAFEKITKVHARDCLVTENGVIFLVDAGKVGLAIGKEGAIIKKVSALLGKPVKVFAHAETPEELVKSMVASVKTVERTGTIIVMTIPQKDRSVVIGKGGANINILKLLLKRHFGITDVRLR